MEGWYEVSVRDLSDLRVLALFTQAGGLFRVLKQFRSTYPWDRSKFGRVRWVGEKTLGVHIRELFPNQEVIKRFPLSPTLSISYYLPDLRVAFDYQTLGDYGLEGKSGEFKVTPKEHVDKVSLTALLGVRVVFIPFWWDRTLGSLASTVLKIDPTLRETLKLDFDSKSFDPIPNDTVIRLSKGKKAQQ